MEPRLLVWFNPDYNLGYLCIHSTTQPLHQGAGDARKMKPEEFLAKVELKVMGSIPD